MGRAFLFFTIMVLACSFKAASQLRLKDAFDSSSKKLSLKVLPQNFYNQQLSFTCRKELQLQKLTSLPLFIRLGSKDYVDYLERKPNAARIVGY